MLKLHLYYDSLPVVNSLALCPSLKRSSGGLFRRLPLRAVARGKD